MKRAIETTALEQIVKGCTYGNFVDVDLLFSMVNDLCEELPSLHINHLDEVITNLELIIKSSTKTKFRSFAALARFAEISVNTLKSYGKLFNLNCGVDINEINGQEKYDANKLLKSLKEYQKLIETQQSKRMKTKG